ncbi:hypothetical protein ACU686_04855 [Yinghuangia aomiensis]
MGVDAAHDAIARAHDAIEKVTGRESPRNCARPTATLGGIDALAAADLGYDATLWSLQMVEYIEYANSSSGPRLLHRRLGPARHDPPRPRAPAPRTAWWR